MGIRDEAALFHAKISTVEYVASPKDSQHAEQTRESSIVGEKPDLTYSRHTLSNRFSFAKRRPRCQTEKSRNAIGQVLFNCASETGIQYRTGEFNFWDWELPGLRNIPRRTCHGYITCCEGIDDQESKRDLTDKAIDPNCISLWTFTGKSSL